MPRVPVSNRQTVVTGQNLLVYSEDFSNAAWLKHDGVTATAATGDTTDPFGQGSASKIFYDGVTGMPSDWRFYQAGPVVTAGTPIYMSVWLRVLSGSLALRITDNTSLQWFDITVTTVWQRFSYGARAVAAGTSQCAVYDAVSANAQFTMYAFGGQLVQSNYAGPYTRTTSSVVNNGGIRLLASGRAPVGGRTPV